MDQDVTLAGLGQNASRGRPDLVLVRQIDGLVGGLVQGQDRVIGGQGGHDAAADGARAPGDHRDPGGWLQVLRTGPRAYPGAAVHPRSSSSIRLPSGSARNDIATPGSGEG